MDWRMAMLFTLLLWGGYSIFGAKAGEVHGEKVSLIFETGAFILLSLVIVGGSFADFHRVTKQSFLNASLMGLMSAGGFFFLLYALRLAPQQLPIIILVTGLYPLITVVTTHFMGHRLEPQQWLGIVLGAVALVLVNWKR